MRKTLLFVVAISLIGCANLPGNPQRHGGMTEATIEKAPDGSFKGRIIDGKDRGGSKLDMTMPDGTEVHFESEQVDASTAQAQQAAANAAIMERLAGSADKLIEKIPAVSP